MRAAHAWYCPSRTRRAVLFLAVGGDAPFRCGETSAGELGERVPKGSLCTRGPFGYIHNPITFPPTGGRPMVAPTVLRSSCLRNHSFIRAAASFFISSFFYRRGEHCSSARTASRPLHQKGPDILPQSRFLCYFLFLKKETSPFVPSFPLVSPRPLPFSAPRGILKCTIQQARFRPCVK